MDTNRDSFEQIRARLEKDVAATLGIARVELVRAAAANLCSFQDQPDADQLIEDVQQAIHDTFVDTTWPTCPRHQRHPLWYTNGRWWCSADQAPIASLGDLAPPPR